MSRFTMPTCSLFVLLASCSSSLLAQRDVNRGRPVSFVGLAEVAVQCAEEEYESKNEAILRLKRACFDDPRLHGVWVFNWVPKPQDNGKILHFVDVILDPARKEEQLKLIEGLVDSIRFNSNEFEKTQIANHFELPVAELLTSVRARLARELDDPGELLAGVYFYDPAWDTPPVDPLNVTDAVLRLMPFGRGNDQAQIERIVAAIDQFRSTNETWKATRATIQGDTNKKDFVVLSDKLRPFEVTAGLSRDLKNLQRLQNRDARLATVLVELAECRNHLDDVTHYDAYVTLDSALVDEQAPAIEELLGQLTHRVDMWHQRPVPFSELVRSWNYEFEACQEFDGCWLERMQLVAGFDQGDYVIQMMLVGQVAVESQRDAIDKLARTSIAEDIRFDGIGHFGGLVPDVSRLRHRPISISLAMSMFDQGYYDFMEAIELQRKATSLDLSGKSNEAAPLRRKALANLENANTLFDAARVSAPAFSLFRYWHILTLIELDQLAEAREHMRSLIRHGFPHEDYAFACRYLESIQGDRRQALVDLFDAMNVVFIRQGRPDCRP